MKERYEKKSLAVLCVSCGETSLVTKNTNVCSCCGTKFSVDIKKLFDDLASVDQQFDSDVIKAALISFVIATVAAGIIWGGWIVYGILFHVFGIPVLCLGMVVGLIYAQCRKQFSTKRKFPELFDLFKRKEVMLKLP